MPESVIVVAPHPDDEAIGCGGAVLAHTECGDRVHAVFLTSGELGLKHLSREQAWGIRESEAREAGQVLGISKLTFLRQPDWYVGEHITTTGDALGEIIAAEQPVTVYLPHPDEWHPDHKAALPVVRGALATTANCRPSLLMYEIWTPLAAYDIVRDVTGVIRRKLNAIRRYKSQLSDFRYDSAILGLNRYRGVLAAKVRFAEVFQSKSLTT